MSSTPDLPLAGLTVVEMHAIGPVPFAGHLLRSIGARVIRVSPPADPGLGVARPDEFDVLNHGKELRKLDLKSADGLAALHELLGSADVMLEGFRPGVLERLGLAPATLLERHPRLVIGRLSGWGLRGEWSDRAGHDINYLALCGVLNAIGTGETPVAPLNVVGDFGGGAMYLLVGVLAKLVQRSMHGRGGTVETSILAGSVGLTPMFYGMLASGMWNLQRANNLLDGSTPYYGVYRTKDDRFVAVGALENKFFRELLKMTGLEGEIEADRQTDKRTWPAMKAKLAARFAEHTRDEWAALAVRCDACVAPVLDFIEATANRHNVDNALYRAEPFPQTARILEFDRRPG